jgi:hypothetical protein
MLHKLNTFLATAAILGGIAAATTVFADESAPAPSSHGMMARHGGGTTMMGEMSPDQMTRMTEMVDRCNLMMEHTNSAPTGPDKGEAPASHE